jgi:hypothetical protein
MELTTLNLDFAAVAACHEITTRQEPGYLAKFLAHRIWHNRVFDGRWINLHNARSDFLRRKIRLVLYM